MPKKKKFKSPHSSHSKAFSNQAQDQKTHLREHQHPSARRWEGSNGSRMDVPSEGKKTTTLSLGSAAGRERKEEKKGGLKTRF